MVETRSSRRRRVSDAKVAGKTGGGKAEEELGGGHRDEIEVVPDWLTAAVMGATAAALVPAMKYSGQVVQ